MTRQREKYLIDTVDFFAIRNRNERRVIDCMREILEADESRALSEENLHDIYAYSLNQLQARYAQLGTIILRDPVRKDDVRKVVQEAFTVILNNPRR